MVEATEQTMHLENVLVPTAVAKAGMTVRDVFRECVEAGVRAIPFCDGDNHVVGLCSLKHVTKQALVPDYIVESANLLGDQYRVLEEVHARVREILDQPIEPFVIESFVAVGSNAPLMKAVALMEKNRIDYALVIDDQQYRGVVSILSIARRMLEVLIVPKHLDPDLLQDPPKALAAARLGGDCKVLKDLARMERETDILHRHIIAYLTNTSTGKVTPTQIKEIVDLMEVANDLEHIADVIEVDMADLANLFIRHRIVPGEQASKEIHELAKLIMEAFDLGCSAVIERRPQAAREVMRMANEIYHRANTTARLGAQRLVLEDPNRIYAYSREIESIHNLMHVFAYTKRFAGTTLPESSMQSESE
jgi:CBS domain-containing protein/phosphate uptake regulator